MDAGDQNGYAFTTPPNASFTLLQVALAYLTAGTGLPSYAGRDPFPIPGANTEKQGSALKMRRFIETICTVCT
jgi:hypothetical protein